MKIVYNSIIPFKGFSSVTLWPWIFVRLGVHLTERLVNHESIHIEQQKEMLAVGAAIALVMLLAGCGWWSLTALPLFLWWYGLEYIIKLVASRFDGDRAYRSIGFEQEAYRYQDDLSYLDGRRRFAWVKDIFRLVPKKNS